MLLNKTSSRNTLQQVENDCIILLLLLSSSSSSSDDKRSVAPIPRIPHPFVAAACARYNTAEGYDEISSYFVCKHQMACWPREIYGLNPKLNPTRLFCLIVYLFSWVVTLSISGFCQQLIATPSSVSRSAATRTSTPDTTGTATGGLWASSLSCLPRKNHNRVCALLVKEFWP